MKTDSPFARRQAAFLGALYDECIIDDTSLAARLVEMGQPCDRSTLNKYRDGTRTAPIALLWFILRHLKGDQAKRALVLDLIARDFNLRVVDGDSPGALVTAMRDRFLDLTGLLGEATAAYRKAVADGNLDDTERAALWTIVDGLVREACALRDELAPKSSTTRRPGRTAAQLLRGTDS